MPMLQHRYRCVTASQTHCDQKSTAPLTLLGGVLSCRLQYRRSKSCSGRRTSSPQMLKLNARNFSSNWTVRLSAACKQHLMAFQSIACMHLCHLRQMAPEVLIGCFWLAHLKDEHAYVINLHVAGVQPWHAAGFALLLPVCGDPSAHKGTSDLILGTWWVAALCLFMSWSQPLCDV